MDFPGKREVELKLEVRPQDVPLISSLKSLPQTRFSAPKAEQIYSVYFDTPDHGLHRTGLTLRVRHSGARRLQTVKADANGSGALLDRREDEIALKGAAPDVLQIGDEGLREKVGAAMAEHVLSPVFETTVLRTTRRIRTETGSEIELAIDTGDLRADGRARAICEVELELKEGDPAALYDVARALNAKATMRVMRISKSDRGYALRGEAIAKPQKARPLVLDKDASVEDAFRATVGDCLAQALANEPAVVEARDVEGLHQLRVALRRLRSALKLFSPVAGGERLAALEAQVKELAHVCGEARDFDVFISDLLPRGEKTLKASRPALKALRASAAQAREQAWERLLAHLAAPEFTALLLDLAALAAGGPEALGHRARRKLRGESARHFAKTALDKAFKKCNRLGRQLDDLDDEDRHELRKRLKELRYCGEFFTSLFERKAARAYSKKLNALQDTFGALNDLATAQGLIEQLTREAGAGAALAKAGEALVAGYLEAAHEARAQASESWTKFAQQRPFWQEA